MRKWQHRWNVYVCPSPYARSGDGVGWAVGGWLVEMKVMTAGETVARFAR